MHIQFRNQSGCQSLAVSPKYYRLNVESMLSFTFVISKKFAVFNLFGNGMELYGKVSEKSFLEKQTLAQVASAAPGNSNTYGPA